MNDVLLDEMMAEIHWDFTHPSSPDIPIRGMTECRTISVANQVAAILNETHGDGTHTVKKMNYTWAERLNHTV